MAMLEELEIRNVEASYWRINGINITTTGKMAQIFIIGYKTIEDRELNRNIVSHNYIVDTSNYEKYFNDDILQQEGNSPISQAYKYLQENIEIFKNAKNN